MKRVKVTAVSILALSLFLSLSVLSQTKDEVVLKYNEGVELAGSDVKAAVDVFEQVHEMATAVGAEADDIKNLVESQISQLQYKYATQLYKEKKIDEAIDNFVKAREMAETYGDDKTSGKAVDIVSKLYFARGNSFYKNDDLENALNDFNQSLEYNPDYAKAHLSKGLVFKKMDDQENMIASMDMAIEKARRDNDEKTMSTAGKVVRDHLLIQANTSIQAGNFDEAINLLNKATGYGEESPQTYYLLAVAHNKTSGWDQAIDAANKGLEIEEETNESKAKFYFELGNAFMGKGDNSAACDAYKNAAYGNYAESANYQINTVLNCN